MSWRTFLPLSRAAFSVPPVLASAAAAFAFSRRPVFTQEHIERLPTDNKDNTHPKKTVALLGATGGCGRHVLLQALARGHQVTALARDPSKLPSSPASPHNLRIVQGDALNPVSVQQTIESADVVISCIGARSRDDTIMTEVATTLNKVMDKNNQKLVMMTSLGCGGTSPVVNFFMRFIVGFGAMEDMDQADTMVRENFSKYVVVRPPRIDGAPLPALSGDGEEQIADREDRDKKYFATTEYPRFCPIACGIRRDAVAEFLVDCIEAEDWDGTAVQIYGA